MTNIVLDASAWLAVVHDEFGAETVEAVIAEATMSTVNFSEAVAKLTDRSFSEADVRATIARVPATLVEFDERQAYAAGLLRPVTRRLGLSLADRACLALAKTLALPVLTGDRAWASLDVGVEIRLFR